MREGVSPDDARRELLARVAELYYIEERDQAQIALDVGTSRSNVSRLLTEARRKGVVEIRINHPVGRSASIEDALRETYGVSEARVLRAGRAQTDEEALVLVGRLAADLLVENLREGISIGMSWGTSIKAFVHAVPSGRAYSLDVVQLVGGSSSVSPSVGGHELGRELAERLGGTFYYLHAPAIVESSATRDSLVRQPGVADVLKRGSRCDLAFVGVGSFGSGSSRALFQEAHLTEDESRQIGACGAVSDICARLFDHAGRPCRTSLDDRIVGIELENLRAIPLVVGVASGKEKVPGISAALRGGLLDVIVTDEETAREVLRPVVRV